LFTPAEAQVHASAAQRRYSMWASWAQGIMLVL